MRVSVCHCLDCQRRSGSAFATQARWPVGQVEVSGVSNTWMQTGEEGNETTFHFCPWCGGTVMFASTNAPDTVAVPVGTFADPAFPTPHYSVWEERKHAWLTVNGEGMEHYE